MYDIILALKTQGCGIVGRKLHSREMPDGARHLENFTELTAERLL